MKAKPPCQPAPIRAFEGVVSAQYFAAAGKFEAIA
jgi:hypothetical protein